MKLEIIFMKLLKQVTNVNDYGFLYYVFEWPFVEYLVHLLLFGLFLLIFRLILRVVLGTQDIIVTTKVSVSHMLK